MMDSSNTNSWLHPGLICCSRCQEALYCVDHSPFYDCYFFYCERCANRAEVGFYDPVYTALFNEIATGQGWAVSNLMSAVEQRLKLCCGGHFRHDAPRRCHACQTEVITNAPWVDLWPSYYALDVDERDPTEEEFALVEAFEARRLRRSDLWKP